MTSQVLQPKSVNKWYKGRHTFISLYTSGVFNLNCVKISLKEQESGLEWFIWINDNKLLLLNRHQLACERCLLFKKLIRLCRCKTTKWLSPRDVSDEKKWNNMFLQRILENSFAIAGRDHKLKLDFDTWFQTIEFVPDNLAQIVLICAILYVQTHYLPRNLK